jgi:hypothetical protein
MALNAANFDMKLKQIKFAPDIADADREMIATMATINKGGEATVRVKEVKDGKDTGEFIEKAISQLNPDDIKLLKEQQELQGKSMEDIAIDQLSEQQKTNSSIDKLITTIQSGGAMLFTPTYKEVLKQTSGSVKKVTPTVKDVIDTPDKINDILKEYGLDMGGIIKGFEEWVTGLKKMDIPGTIEKGFNDLLGFSSVTPKSTATSAGTTISPVSSLATTAGTTPPPTNTTTTTNIAMTHTFDFTNLPPNMTNEQITTILKDFVKNPLNANEIVKAASTINSGLIA